jgi:hypothetical protein
VAVPVFCNGTPWGTAGGYLFEIVMRRHETRSTIMTSNRPLDDWGKILGEVPSAKTCRQLLCKSTPA